MSGRRRLSMLIVLAAVLLALVAGVETRLGGRSQASTQVLDGNRYLVGLALGGFRAPLASIYWLKVDLDFRKGRYFDTARNIETVAALNPRGTDRRGDSVWDYGAWHLAFNLTASVEKPAERLRYVLEGLNLARQGTRHLPRSRNLLRTISDICIFKGTADRVGFREAEGQEPEAIAFVAYGRLISLPDATWIDLALFAEVALAYGERLLIAGRWGEAQNVLGERVEKLELARRLAKEGRAKPEELALLRRDRQTADKWYAAARATVAGDLSIGVTRLEEARSWLIATSLWAYWLSASARPVGFETEGVGAGDVEVWVRRMELVIQSLDARLGTRK